MESTNHPCNKVQWLAEPDKGPRAYKNVPYVEKRETGQYRWRCCLCETGWMSRKILFAHFQGANHQKQYASFRGAKAFMNQIQCFETAYVAKNEQMKEKCRELQDQAAKVGQEARGQIEHCLLMYLLENNDSELQNARQLLQVSEEQHESKHVVENVAAIQTHSIGSKNISAPISDESDYNSSSMSSSEDSEQSLDESSYDFCENCEEVSVGLETKQATVPNSTAKTPTNTENVKSKPQETPADVRVAKACLLELSLF